MGTSVWFPIGNGPLLKAADKLLKNLKQKRDAGNLDGGYKIGAQRGLDKAKGLDREIEIIFGDENDAMVAKLEFY